MSRHVWRVLLAAVLVVSTSTLAFAQATTSISGVLKDSAGGVIPGATVVVKSDTTGATFEAVTAANGTYTIPAAAGRGLYGDGHTDGVQDGASQQRASGAGLTRDD